MAAHTCKKLVNPKLVGVTPKPVAKKTIDKK